MAGHEKKKGNGRDDRKETDGTVKPRVKREEKKKKMKRRQIGSR